jgi:SPP1 gp7 family putative phage head morphogenesis protein
MEAAIRCCLIRKSVTISTHYERVTAMHGTFRAVAVPSISSGSKAKKLRPLHPNLGLSIAYRKKLDRLIKEMNASVVWHIKAVYRANPPAMAMDDVLPTSALQRAIKLLTKRWLKKFDRAAPRLAKYFATAVHKRTDIALAKILRDGGFSVKFQMSEGMKDVLQATTAENVGLIKSIGSQYLGEVEGLVMRSASAGRDLGAMAKQLEKRYGVTKRRAALISKDQNNKASANMQRVRQLEVGITKATWLHSGGGKVPRPTHVANSGKTYDVAKGWFDPHEKQWIHPGTLINCRCVSIPLVPGFS